ncbi:MAG: hypothetical protein V3S41_01045, partial [Spirochaetia bacterium]
MKCTRVGKNRLLTTLLALLLSSPSPLLFAEESQPVEVYSVEHDDGSYGFYADNNHIIPVYV